MTKKRFTPDPYWVRQWKIQRKNAEAYNRVQEILEKGCPKKSVAVKEAAVSLGRSERSVWTSLRMHELQVIEDEKANAQSEREMRITLGEEKPTDEEMQEAADQWIQHLIDLRRGK